MYKRQRPLRGTTRHFLMKFVVIHKLNNLCFYRLYHKRDRYDFVFSRRHGCQRSYDEGTFSLFLSQRLSWISHYRQLINHFNPISWTAYTPLSHVSLRISPYNGTDRRKFSRICYYATSSLSYRSHQNRSLYLILSIFVISVHVTHPPSFFIVTINRRNHHVLA